MRKQYQSVTSSPSFKQSAHPHPLTQHLSLLRTTSIFPVVRSYYYYQGNFSSHSEFHCLSVVTPGFHSTFLTGGGRRPRPLEEGGYPTVQTYIPKHQACLSVKVLPDFPGGLIKFQTSAGVTMKPTITTGLKKRDAHGLELKESGVSVGADMRERWYHFQLISVSDFISITAVVGSGPSHGHLPKVLLAQDDQEILSSPSFLLLSDSVVTTTIIHAGFCM